MNTQEVNYRANINTKILVNIGSDTYDLDWENP